MATPPDPAALDRMATKLEMCALQYENVGAKQIQRVSGLTWEGPAADKFQDLVGNFAKTTKGAAEAMRSLAAGLRTGAQSVREALAKQDD